MKKLMVIFCLFLLITEANSQSLLPNPFNFNFNESKKTLIKKETNNNNKFFFQGTTAINTTEQLNTSLQASQKFIFTVRLIDQDPRTNERKGFKKSLKNHGLDFTVGMNVLNLKPTGVARDSFDLVSLMFPETGNFGLMLTPSHHWCLISKGNTLHRFSTEVSVSLRQNKVNNVYFKNSLGDTISGPQTQEFGILNYNVMLRYNFFYQPEADFKIDFNLGVYLNSFNLPNEDAQSFNKLFPEDKPLFPTSERSSIQSWGVKMSCGINGFLIFADLRQNFDTKGFDDSNPYKGFVYNAGIAQNINIFMK
jgi:hypothetical protein